MAGNSDGHAKKLSLLYQANGEVRLAPFCDLVCTRAIKRIDYHLVFSIGDQRNPNVVSRKHWDTLAQQCGLRPRFLQGLILEIAASLLEKLHSVKEKFETAYGEYAALQRIEQVVTKQCRRTLAGYLPGRVAEPGGIASTGGQDQQTHTDG